MYEGLYILCNQKGYFTCGTSEQYRKMFEMAEKGADAHDLAIMIWLCSCDKEVDVIENEVQKILDEQKYEAIKRGSYVREILEMG